MRARSRGYGGQALGHRAARRRGGGVAQLWQHTGAWLESVDLNPVIVTEAGVAVVDALLVAAPTGGR